MRQMYNVAVKENGMRRILFTEQESFSDAEKIITQSYQGLNLNGAGINWDILSISKQDSNKDLKTTWDFVEKYYPGYSSSDEICRANDLFLILERRNTIMDEEGTELHARYMNEFSGRIFHVEQEYNYLMKEIYEEAINNFIQSQNK